MMQTKIKIRLTENAHIESDSHVLRARDETGKELATGIYDMWYSAMAEDDVGNKYDVFWDILPEYKERAIEEWEDENVCDWDKPYMILDENGKNVKSNVILEDMDSKKNLSKVSEAAASAHPNGMETEAINKRKHKKRR